MFIVGIFEGDAVVVKEGTDAARERAAVADKRRPRRDDMGRDGVF